MHIAYGAYGMRCVRAKANVVGNPNAVDSAVSLHFHKSLVYCCLPYRIVHLRASVFMCIWLYVCSCSCGVDILVPCNRVASREICFLHLRWTSSSPDDRTRSHTSTFSFFMLFSSCFSVRAMLPQLVTELSCSSHKQTKNESAYHFFVCVHFKPLSNDAVE